MGKTYAGVIVFWSPRPHRRLWDHVFVTLMALLGFDARGADVGGAAALFIIDRISICFSFRLGG